ncbi:hypothetical protein ACWDA7_38825 [Streptomyces sp. NPDC001156]
MRWPLVWRSRRDEDLAAAKAETNRQRERAERAEDIARTEVANRRTIAAQYSALYDVNDRLARRNRVLCEQLEAAQVGSGFDRAKAVETAQRIAQAPRAIARARATTADTAANEKGASS